MWLRAFSSLISRALFIREKFFLMGDVGLNYGRFPFQDTWRNRERWIKRRINRSVDSVCRVHQKHVLNSEPLISLVRSDGWDLTEHSASDSATRGKIKAARSRSDGPDHTRPVKPKFPRDLGRPSHQRPDRTAQISSAES